MIDLKLYKNEKQKQSALEFVNAFSEMRKLFNEVKEIADCTNDRYTVAQKNEALELTKGGFFAFVAIMSSVRQN